MKKAINIIEGKIYKIICLITGMIYIGQTTGTLERRFYLHCHRSSGCRYLYNAIKKYGKENFTIEQIATASTQEELNQKEKYLVDKLNTLAPNGYNLKEGGGSTGKMSKVSRRRLSRSQNKRYESEESRLKVSIGQKKRFERQDEIDKNKKRLLKYWSDPERRQEMSEIKKEFYKTTPDILKQMSERTKKQFSDPKQREKMSGIKKEWHKNNPEVAKQHSEKMKEFYISNPEAIEKARQKSLQQFSDPKQRGELSKAKKKMWSDPKFKKKMSNIHSERFRENPKLGEKLSKTLRELYAENPDLGQEHSERLKEYYKTHKHPNIKKYVFYKGEKKIDIENIAKWCRKKDLNRTALYSMSTGKKRSAYGYTAVPASKLDKYWKKQKELNKK